MTGTGADDFALLSQAERIEVLTVDNDAAQPGELEAIRKALKLALPADWGGDLRALWLRSGFAVDDKTRTATGDTAAARRLVGEFDKIRAELRTHRQLAHRVGSTLYAAIDDASSEGRDDLAPEAVNHDYNAIRTVQRAT